MNIYFYEKEYVDGYVKMNFEGVGKYIWINTKNLSYSIVDANGNNCLTGAAPQVTQVLNLKKEVIGAQLTWGANITWNPLADNAVEPS